MGISGFTKFINDRAHLYFENYELRDCTLIIDGHSISCQLYNWKHWQFDARSYNSYGGDYDKYAYIVENFFGMLKEVKVIPIVVFDGGFEQRKLPTILKRMQNKINIADKLNPKFESKQPNSIVFPLFLREAFKDILTNLDIQMVMCEYEADSEIASIAKTLNCPVLTFDSDYFLFGAQYIPFKTLDSKVCAIENWRTGTYKCILCKMYRIEKLLEDIQGLQENTLYLLPVLLGNDYIETKIFHTFLQSIKAGAGTNTQEKILIALNWLKNETPESAITNILKTFNSTDKKLSVLNKVEKIVTGYYFVETRVFKYLNIKCHNKEYKKIDFKNLKKIVESEGSQNGTDCPEKVESTFEHDTSLEDLSTSDTKKVNEVEDNVNSCLTKNGKKSELFDNILENKIETSSCINSSEALSPENEVHDKTLECGEILSEKVETINEEKCFDVEKIIVSSLSVFEETYLEKENISENFISKLFQRNFAKCLYPSSFMDIITQNKYYCIPQIENHCEENSHIYSFDILRAIHKILAGVNSGDFIIVARGEGTKIKWFPQEQYTVALPSIEEIEQLSLQGRRDTLLQILSIDSNSFVPLLEHFPTEWHTFLVALKFAASKTCFETPLIYSLILGFIMLNYIDQRIGYYRSAERYKSKYYSYMQNLSSASKSVPFRADKNCFYYFPLKDCIVFMQKIVHLYTVNWKETAETFDKKLIHQMAQIQSVLLHIKYLNSLLKNPYPILIIHQIFDATFIYNLTKTFEKKSAELENNYLNVFFKDCPSILASLKYVLNMLNKQIIL